MFDKVATFTADLRSRLDAADARIKGVFASAKSATEKAAADAKAQLAALETRAKERAAKVHDAEVAAKAWFETKKTVTEAQIAQWRVQHEVKKLAARADAADQYAVTAMILAAAAVDEAERASVEAVVARMDSDAAKIAAGSTAAKK